MMRVGKWAFCGLLIGAALNLVAFDRAETLQWFRENQFGTTPIGRPEDQKVDATSVSCFGGQIKIEVGCVLPKGASADHPVPVFVFGDHMTADDPPYAPIPYPNIPTNTITSRGYAYVHWHLTDVAPDAALYTKNLDIWAQGIIAYLATGDKMATNGVRSATGKIGSSAWGTLGAWAWGHSRVMDWIESRPELDASRVAIVGHSRGGKAALWAGAQDERFKMVVSNDSGCGGAKLARLGLKKSESIEQILHNFPNWFCPSFAAYIKKDDALPHDADDLLRLIAPRLLYVASAQDDAWAGPAAEKAAWDSAHDVWQSVGLDANLGYHCRPGRHRLQADDWEKFLDFADRRMARAAEADLPVAVRTAQWQARIDATSARGGGTVVVPPGRHLVGELELKSNVRLHLEKGAVLEGAVGLSNYRARLLPFSEGTWSAVVSGYGVTNIAITGEGEIFGNGRAWNPRKGQKDAMGCGEGVRPRGLFFGDCANIRLENFKLRDAACWGIVFKRCDGVVARSVRIDSCVNHNNDGFDIEAKNVLIENCDLNCGDDALCMKSNDPNYVVENVTVRDCVARTHCSAIKFGTASHGTMRKVRFERIRIEAPRRVYRDYAPMPTDLLNAPPVDGAPSYLAGAGIGAICVECVDGGIVEDVVIDGIDLAGFKVPIFVRTGTRKSRGCSIPPNNKYVLRNVLIQNVKGRAESRQVSSISGVKGCRPQGITLRNIEIECVGEGDNKAPIKEPGSELDGLYPEATMFSRYHLPVYGLYVTQADDVKLENVKFTLRPGTTDARPAYRPE
ncbi:MAG: glycosyl hydrolase family 28 protein [bacterium]|nr:glycosyl hydrolase family 28 protein [bacterium]